LEQRGRPMQAIIAAYEARLAELHSTCTARSTPALQFCSSVQQVMTTAVGCSTTVHGGMLKRQLQTQGPVPSPEDIMSKLTREMWPPEDTFDTRDPTNLALFYNLNPLVKELGDAIASAPTLGVPSEFINSTTPRPSESIYLLRFSCWCSHEKVPRQGPCSTSYFCSC
jgi:hypothetical protein